MDPGFKEDLRAHERFMRDRAEARKLMSPEDRRRDERFETWFNLIASLFFGAAPLILVAWASGALHVIVQSPRMVVVVGLALAGVLFALKHWSLRFYGCLEFGVGLATVYASATALADFELAGIVAFLGGVYLLVQAVGNVVSSCARRVK